MIPIPTDREVRDAFERGGDFPPFEASSSERRRVFDEWLSKSSEPARRSRSLERLAQALLHASGHVSRRQCEVSVDYGNVSCGAQAVGIRWEDGFLDAVCKGHASTAETRGAIIIRPVPHDGTVEG